MIRNFEHLIVFTSALGVLPEQFEQYWIQPWKVNEIKVYKKWIKSKKCADFDQIAKISVQLDEYYENEEIALIQKIYDNFQ